MAEHVSAPAPAVGVCGELVPLGQLAYLRASCEELALHTTQSDPRAAAG
jgi:hypothetical protein